MLAGHKLSRCLFDYFINAYLGVADNIDCCRRSWLCCWRDYGLSRLVCNMSGIIGSVPITGLLGQRGVAVHLGRERTFTHRYVRCRRTGSEPDRLHF